MEWTNDPVGDAERYWAEQEEADKDYPKCKACGRTLYDDYYDICGDILCEDCMNSAYHRNVDVY